MKVVAFNGSPRHKGNTVMLIKTVLEELKKEGIQTELIHIGGKKLHGCTACMKCMKNQDKKCVMINDIFNKSFQKMLEADGIIIGSPTYFANVTTEVKALIDRAGFVSRVNGDLLKRKVGAAVVAVRRAGALPTFDAINKLFFISQMVVPGSDYWNLGVGLKEEDVKDDEEGINTMKTLGINMAWLMKQLEQNN